MESFIIPKGKDYTFTMKVMERDSFIAQDLTNMLTASIEFILLSDNTSKFTAPMTVLGDPLDGVLECTLDGLTQTGLLTVLQGDEVDGYYLRPAHKALITVDFTTLSGIPTVFSILDKVYAAPVGI